MTTLDIDNGITTIDVVTWVTNHYATPDSGPDTMSSSEVASFVVLMSACILATILGNVLVVLSVFTYTPLKNVQNYYIVSLAGADIAVALLVMPLNVANFAASGSWPFGAVLCNVWLTCDILTCTASILHLCAIAIDRYYSIHDPIDHALKRTKWRVLLKIAVVWLLSAIISVPPLFFGWKNGTEQHSLYNEATRQCQLTDERGFVVYSALGSFYIPLAIMSFVYVKIFVSTRRRLRARRLATATRPPAVNSETISCGGTLAIGFGIRRVSMPPTTLFPSAAIPRPPSEPIHPYAPRSLLKPDDNDDDDNDVDIMPTNLSPSQLLLDANDYERNGPQRGDNDVTVFGTGDNVVTRNHEVTNGGYEDVRELECFKAPLASAESPDCDIAELTQLTHEDQCYENEGGIGNGGGGISGKRNSGNGILKNSKRGLFSGRNSGVGEGGGGDGGRRSSRGGYTLFKAKVVTSSENQQKEITTFTDRKSEHLTFIEHNIHGGDASPSSPGTTAIVGTTGTTGTTGTGRTVIVTGTTGTAETACAIAATTTPTCNNNSYQSSKSQLCQFAAEKQRISLAKERRAARTMAIIMGAFVVCWLPFFLMYVIFPFCGERCTEETDRRVIHFIVWLGYVNSTLNPVIYTVFNVDYRRAFQNLLTGKCHLVR